jgi:hypothetical protein
LVWREEHLIAEPAQRVSGCAGIAERARHGIPAPSIESDAHRKEPTVPNGKPNILVIWGDDIGISNLSATATA